MEKKYVVYEIWSRARVVTAKSEEQALEDMPEPVAGMDLANWHAVEVAAEKPRGIVRAK